eukprot:COSAG05_NODE_26114_length_190_cov_124.065934_1_plen_49_part_01
MQDQQASGIVGANDYDFFPIHGALKTISVAAREPSRHESLLASGVVDAL